MLNYTKMSLEDVNRRDIHDIIGDLARDIMGWGMNLQAMTEQGSVIDERQIAPAVASLYYASEALTEVQRAVDAIIYGGKDSD